MRIEEINLHGLSLAEAMEKANKNISWALQHNIDVLVFNHGKGHHSQRNFSVIKKEIRKMLKENDSLRENGYIVIYGESDWPIALTYDEGHTLLAVRGLEKEMIGGRVRQQKSRQVFSEDARQERKAGKKLRAEKRSRSNKFKAY